MTMVRSDNQTAQVSLGSANMNAQGILQPNLMAASAGQARNPFAPISSGWMFALLSYIFIFKIIAPSFNLYGIDTTYLTIERLIAYYIYTILLYLPLCFAHRTFGWVHPLVFPALLGELQALFREPLQPLISLVGSEPFLMAGSASSALSGFGLEELAWARLKLDLLNISGLLGLYAGFFLLPSARVPQLLTKPRSHWRWRLIALFGLSLLLLFVAAITYYGSLANWILSFTQGRFQRLEAGLGPIIAIATRAPLIVLLWYAMDEKAYKRPIFWALAPAAILLPFLASGSRSGVAITVALFGLIWILRNRTIPTGRILAAMALMFLLFGALGALRQDYGARELNLDLLRPSNIASWLDTASREIEQRGASDADLAVIARASEVGWLNGRTYLAGLTFWVPRALWSDKPRGVGSYVASAVFGHQPLAWRPDAPGIPIGPVTEAYWNFGLFAPFFVMIALGMLYKILSIFFVRNQQNGVAVVFYVVLLVFFRPTGDGMVATFQILVLLAVVVALTFRVKVHNFGVPRANGHHTRKHSNR